MKIDAKNASDAEFTSYVSASALLPERKYNKLYVIKTYIIFVRFQDVFIFAKRSPSAIFANVICIHGQIMHT